MPYDVNKVVELAKQQVGYLEKKNGDLKYLYDKKANAGTANYTKYGYDLRKIYPEVIDYPAFWCSAFVSWLFVQCYGVSDARKLMAGDFEDYTVRQASLYKAKGAWHSYPEIGDQIFFHNGTRICHTGLVVDVIPSSNTVVVIEGNTSPQANSSTDGEVIPNGGGVWQKYYKMSNSRIAGYGRPAYGKSFSFTPHWVLSNGTWYYRVSDNTNAHGWLVVNHHWYYFHETSGAMQTGLKVINGSLYYLMESGELEGACCKTSESGALSPWYVE